MSKIKSPKYAISKLVFGVFVAAALIIAFACEQKESVETVAPEEQVVKLTIQGEKLKIDGTADDIQKLKSMFSEDSGFEIVTDSLGNVLLTKKAAEVLKTLDSDEQIFFIVEDMPEFPGGEMALRTYIANAVKYPVTAQEKGIQGKVYVTFVVGKDGFVKNTSIAKGVDPSLDSEALRVINNLPKWKPGIQKGVPVNVSYTVPINFKLQ